MVEPVRTVEHEGKVYDITHGADGLWHVTDVSGATPPGLRGKGPWRSIDEAEDAVRSLGGEQARG
jgi:hypothetical protein